MGDFERVDLLMKNVRRYLDDARNEYQAGPASAPASIGHMIDALISLAGAVELLRGATEEAHATVGRMLPK
jgi:hypothetical protein